MKGLFGNPRAKAKGSDLVLGSKNEERTAIAQSDAALGMLSIAWKNDAVKGLPLIDEKGDTLPPRRKVLAGTDYPFARELYLITRREPKGLAEGFIEFLKSEEGQGIVEKNGYVSVAE